MQKSQVRLLKKHYGVRWRSTTPDLHEKYVLQMLVPGTSLAFDCVTVPAPDLAINQLGSYNNVLALNLPRFKYKTLEELANQIKQLQQQTCYQGHIFVSFNFQFVNFNRFREDFSTALQKWINDLAQHKIMLVKNLTRKLPRTNDWGDCFFIFKNYEIPTDNLL
jgi:uncharacterized protein YukE